MDTQRKAPKKLSSKRASNQLTQLENAYPRKWLGILVIRARGSSVGTAGSST